MPGSREEREISVRVLYNINKKWEFTITLLTEQ
jgi:hypothetical protein